jgi:hypothetical protein
MLTLRIFVCIVDSFFTLKHTFPASSGLRYLTEQVPEAKGLERLNPAGVGWQQGAPLNPSLYYILPWI